MPTLHGFGTRVIRSAVPFHALPRGRATNCSAVIELDWDSDCIPGDVIWDHHWRDDGEVVLSLARHEDGYWLRVPDLADFRLQLAPERVFVAAAAGELDTVTLEHLLVDQIMPRVLSASGHLLVHASALRIQKQHALFIAPSGWGKSTLAALLHQRGHTVLSDDCLQLDAVGESFRATPTYPSLRLNPDSLAAIFPDLPESQPVADYSDKRRVPMPGHQDEVESDGDGSVAVDALYLLGDPEGSADGTITITPLHPAETCMRLIKHSFRLDLTDPVANAAHLERCSQVARAIPAFRLDYPRDFTQGPELERAIVQHLADVASTSGKIQSS